MRCRASLSPNQMCERILTLAFDITEDERAPIASEALERTPCGAPGTHQAPRAVAQSAWLEEQLAQVSRPPRPSVMP
jgi:hypothetical protein